MMCYIILIDNGGRKKSANKYTNNIYQQYIEKNIPNIYQTYTNKYTKQVPVRPVRGPGLGPGRAGPAAAWYFVYLGISLYIFVYLDIFGYIFGIFLYMFGVILTFFPPRLPTTAN